MEEPQQAPGLSAPPDHRPFVPDADGIVDRLPWIVGRSPAQHRRARGRAAALVSQIAQMLAAGWTVVEVVEILEDADLSGISDADGQQSRWRKALKKANTARRRAAS